MARTRKRTKTPKDKTKTRGGASVENAQRVGLWPTVVFTSEIQIALDNLKQVLISKHMLEEEFGSLKRSEMTKTPPKSPTQYAETLYRQIAEQQGKRFFHMKNYEGDDNVFLDIMKDVFNAENIVSEHEKGYMFEHSMLSSKVKNAAVIDAGPNKQDFDKYVTETRGFLRSNQFLNARESLNKAHLSYLALIDLYGVGNVEFLYNRLMKAYELANLALEVRMGIVPEEVSSVKALQEVPEYVHPKGPHNQNEISTQFLNMKLNSQNQIPTLIQNDDNNLAKHLNTSLNRGLDSKIDNIKNEIDRLENSIVTLQKTLDTGNSGFLDLHRVRERMIIEINPKLEHLRIELRDLIKTSDNRRNTTKGARKRYVENLKKRKTHRSTPY